MTADDIAATHQWHGGYFCTCGHELNSPRGFTLHVLEVAGVDAALAALGRVEALADPEVFAQRLYWQSGLPDDDRKRKEADPVAGARGASDVDDAPCPDERGPYRCVRRYGHKSRHESRTPGGLRCFWVDNGPYWLDDPPPVPMPTWDRNGPTGEAMA